ncbi:uncharacterized protein LOC116288950 [Actinia tenebrosa]|uniref:Uncharacterized protein LOC116288950 n=1 Tax=Actinia tenebrosa TaxID=6105 RepID=A0A6P8HGG5_ACTTE|nr:uncharacterized protein LOC116288950 [Actinia tenebrosa]
MEEEEDNLSEGNTDKTVSLKEEEDNSNEESTDKTVSLKEEEDNLNEESTDKTVSMEKEEDNLSEESTNKTVSMEEEEDNLSKGNTDKTVSLEKEKDNLNEENTSFFKHSKMALSSTKTSLTKNAISQFHKICTKIALELVTRDVKALKYLTLDKVPGGVLEEIKAEEEYSGLKWR